MNRPLKIGITGGIGSGKSLVCKLFRLLSVPVYDADSRAKWLMVSDPELMRGVKDLFGESAYSENNLNRELIASKTFSDTAKLEALNSLVHPAVGRDFNSWYLNQEGPYVIKEAALLIESGSFRQLDKLINVYSPADLRLARVLRRDSHRDKKQVELIMSRQLPDEERMKVADYTVMNDEKEMVIPQVLKLDSLFRGMV